MGTVPKEASLAPPKKIKAKVSRPKLLKVPKQLNKSIPRKEHEPSLSDPSEPAWDLKIANRVLQLSEQMKEVHQQLLMLPANLELVVEIKNLKYSLKEVEQTVEEIEVAMVV